MNRSSRAKPRDRSRIGRDRDRVRVVDDERLDLRAECGVARMQQGVADRAHVDYAAALRGQPGSRSGRCSAAESTGDQPDVDSSSAAGAMAPGARQRRQAGDRAHRVAAAAHALHAVVQADRRRLRRAVVAREADDHLLVDAADLRDARSADNPSARAAARPAQRVRAM